MAGRGRVFGWVVPAFNLLMTGGLIAFLTSRPCDDWSMACDESRFLWGLWLIPLVGVWLLGDIVLALAGRLRRRRHWLVSAPGADLTEYPRSSWPVARLTAGSLVTEIGRMGSQARVAAEDGTTGWVAGEGLEPTGERGP
jgi:hypothetical protein